MCPTVTSQDKQDRHTEQETYFLPPLQFNIPESGSVCDHCCFHFKGSRPEWCISSMIYSRDIPFWSKTLDLEVHLPTSGRVPGSSNIRKCA